MSTPAKRLIALLLLALGASCSAPPAVPVEWKRLELSILEDYDKGESLEGVDRDFALFQELGIRTWRGSFGWDDYEPARGRFDFEWLHRFADLAAARGIRLRPYIGYTPEWAAAGRRADGAIWNDPPARLEDWSGFVGALASAMARHPNIVSYEIYNEENAREWWDGSAAEYESVLVAASRAVRATQPRARVLLGGLVWPDPDWVETVCAAGASTFDVAPFHAYPETWTPDSIRIENYLTGSYGDFLETVDACDPGKEIWINETGFATVPGKSEHDQAVWWARALATFAAAPRVTGIGVYEIKDLRPDRPAIGGAPNYHLGLTTADRRKKLAFHTVALLAAFFDAESVAVEDRGLTLAIEGVPPGSVAGNGDVHAHLFRRPDGARLLVAWARGGAKTVKIGLPDRARRARLYALDGESTPLAGLSGRSLRDLRLEPGEVRIIRLDP